jgi:co-chaperonin GroES (HSP10)
MNFRPLHDRVVIRHLNAEEKTAGGINTAQERLMARSSLLGPALATSKPN